MGHELVAADGCGFNSNMLQAMATDPLQAVVETIPDRHLGLGVCRHAAGTSRRGGCLEQQSRRDPRREP
jgi:hypothetical protein